MKKTEAIAFAQKLGWTKADAQRAYEELKVDFADLQSTLDYYKYQYGVDDVTERDIAVLALVLADFAGEVLLDRQRKQAAQQAVATKRKDKIKEIELNHVKEIADVKKSVKDQESKLMEFIVKLCNIAKNLGFKPDPWLEALIEAYEETKNGFDYSQTAM
jgi:hypothetical protein